MSVRAPGRSLGQPERRLIALAIRALAAPARDGIWDEADGLWPTVDPYVLASELARQRLLVTIGVPLVERVAHAASGELPSRVGAARTRARHRGLLLQTTIQRVSSRLEADGIDSVPLKGAPLAEYVHGDLGARESSDVDLLVSVDRLDDAVAVLEGLGWSQAQPGRADKGLPPLHRALVHPELPVVELHWRVHWYENTFAQQALARARPGPDGLNRLEPVDELCFVLLFLARDGFAGLRQVTDVAAWWGRLGDRGRGAGVSAAAGSHPDLAPALGTAAHLVEAVAGLPPGSLCAGRAALSRRQRAALRLADPWLLRPSHQLAAEISLVDGLLAPPGGLPAFLRRQIFPPSRSFLSARPELTSRSPLRVAAERVGHAARVSARYGLAGWRLTGRPPNSVR